MQKGRLVEDLGRVAGFTRHSSPSRLFPVSAWRDGAEANLYGEVFRRFIKEWLQTDVDQRRIKGVEISSLFPLSSADTSVVKRFAQANVSQCSYWRASAYVGGPNLLTWYGIYQ